MTAEEYFNKGIEFYQNYEYGPALENFRTALKLCEPDSEVSEACRKIINALEEGIAAGDFEID